MATAPRKGLSAKGPVNEKPSTGRDGLDDRDRSGCPQEHPRTRGRRRRHRQLLGEREIAAREQGHLEALRWAHELDSELVWAIEDCRELSHHLEQALIAAGERVVRVAPKLMGASRRGEREPGKSDQIDSRAIARAVLREGDRHRLDRGGNRQLNRALHVIAITRGRIDPQTRAYLARKEAEGKSRIEAMRCLKRHLARTYYRLLSEGSTGKQKVPSQRSQ